MSEETKKEPESTEIPIEGADGNPASAKEADNAETSGETSAGSAADAAGADEAGNQAESDNTDGTGNSAESGEADSDSAEEEAGSAGDSENPKDFVNGKDDAKTEDAKKKTSFFSKKKKEKDKFEQQVEDLTDRLKRTMAEFDNFRKRTEKEKASMYVIGARDIVEKILPIVDSFERGLTQAPEDDAFADGMRMIYKQLQKALDDMGVKPIEAVGKEFDPNLHNAVMHVDDESVGDNIIVEEFQKGYTYKDFVVRHSMVKVAN